ncbi:MAG: hypothetical protein HKN85_04895 [Gammaproteobacteria bacterium]|nr:hypothetical protein [Gammaproteobacteria bacterium]
MASKGDTTRLNEFINLERYPIHDLGSPAGVELIDRGRRMMAANTLCLFEDFLRADTVALLRNEIAGLEELAHKVDYPCTVYGWMNNTGFPEDHPRSRLLRRQCGVITTDQLDAESHCLELFRFNELTEFVRRLLGYETLYRSECPTLAIQINTMNDGESFDWHFDTNDGVVSFTIQNADRGGAFEYAPLIRAEDDEHYDAVRDMLDAVSTPIRAKTPPGTFSLFLGRRSLHRVAEVGPTTQSRQSLLLSYDRNPGMVFPEQTRERITSGSSEPYRGAGAG